MQYCAMTDPGMVRLTNEDYVFASDRPEGALANLFIVADGMGGHKAGEVASHLAITTVLESVRESKETSSEEIINAAIHKANQVVYTLASKETDKAGMGTTMVAATIDEEILISNVGDSRAYVLTEEGLKQVSVDHTVVEEMIRNGSLSKQAAKHHPNRHMITRAVGAEEHVKIDFFHMKKEGVKQILLSSDGLTNMIEHAKIEEILQGTDTVSEKGKQLMALANANGGTDNITLLLIEL